MSRRDPTRMRPKIRRPRALIYVQHLLGIGHLARIGRVAEAMAEAGMAVRMARGGPAGAYPAPMGVEVAQLTPVRVESADMSVLLHADGRPFGETDRSARRDQLLGLLEQVQPDILVVEAYPFGRRQMRFELTPLLERARAIGTPLIAGSIRDILQESRKPGRAEETAEVVARYLDIVLVHGDEETTPLSLTFPLAGRIAARLRYTGLVGPPPIGEAIRDHAVIVSAGGGAVGGALLKTAIAARPLTTLADTPWLLLAGQNMPEAEFQALEAQAGGSVALRRATPDLPRRLAGALLSISQAGYNTVAEILSCGCRSVLAPFAAGGETEQSARAMALARAGRAAVVPERGLSPGTLAQAIAEAMVLPRAAPRVLDGARRSAEILLAALAERRSGVPYPQMQHLGAERPA